MARSIPAPVEPSVLRWARESIDLSAVAASRKMGLPDDRVAAWEAGTSTPTIAQLRKASHIYKRSLGVFFLSEPPRDFDTLRDFRRIDGADTGAWSSALHDNFRRAHEQRDAVMELAELDEVIPATDWRIDPLPINDEELAKVARAHLLDLGPLPLPGGGDDPYAHLNAWVAALETAGVLVMATGGGRVSIDEMRAFSLYFDEVPVIVLNGADNPRGRIFSLLHEYAHLLLHTDGLCDTSTDRRATTPNRRLEARCNALAAAILLPRELVLASSAVSDQQLSGSPWTYERLRRASAPFGVSAEAFLRRLVTIGLVSEAFYAQTREEFLRAYKREAASSRPPRGNWYRNTVRDRGKAFVRLVTNAHRRRVIDTYTAATFLDVKANQLDRLAEAAAIADEAVV